MSRLRSSPVAERSLLVALTALLIGAGASPSVVVTRRGDQLDVEARNAPVAEVLDALAAELGMKVEYEGSPPRQLLTLTLHGRTPAEAVLSVLDGQGVDYALRLDASGQGVARLLIQASGAGAPRRTRPRPAVRPAPPPAPTPPPVPEFAQPFDPPEEEPAPAEPAEPTEEANPGDPAAPLRPGLRPPTAKPGRPTPAPLLFPGPVTPGFPGAPTPAAPTPTPPPRG